MTTQTNPFSHKLITQPLRDSTEPSSLIWNPSNSWDNPPYVGEPTTLVPVCCHQLPQLLPSVVSFALTGCSDFTTLLFRWHLPHLYESHLPQKLSGDQSRSTAGKSQCWTRWRVFQTDLLLAAIPVLGCHSLCHCPLVLVRAVQDMSAELDQINTQTGVSK